ncbi:MAG TPA: hypothetical protein VKD69_17895 [Vicinamibacterales bacterium]|nr:hypothetical protein [Vicinamibacterales bacterium]
MTESPTLKPIALIPIAMSVAAIVTIAVHIALAGTAPQPDEGAAAHIWQILMAGQVPIVAFFALTWLPRAPAAAVRVLAVQIAAACGALFPVYWFGW